METKHVYIKTIYIYIYINTIYMFFWEIKLYVPIVYNFVS